MADIRPFRCIRPSKEAASTVAALPYDVYSRKEAKQEVEGNPGSFLAIDRAETQFADDVDLHDPRVYEKARDMLEEWQQKGVFLADGSECYYIYKLTMDGRGQAGIVACASLDDYVNGIIKKHENTREEKEQDRICHVDVTNAHTGPIFLAYRSDHELNRIVEEACMGAPLYDFVAKDGIRHQVWKVADGLAASCIHRRFSEIGPIYIADGHHRAASAVKVGLKRRAGRPGYTGEEPFNYFLSVLFPDDQLMVLSYNRVVKGLNGYGKEAFLEAVAQRFAIEPCREAKGPKARHHMEMYFDGRWYGLAVRPEYIPDGLVEALDVSILQDVLLAPVLGIQDPRTDGRIQFVGGIRGMGELERLVDRGDGAVAFAMYPTSMQELFAVADAGLLMPPKSTWFEPKLRSGLFIHKLS